LGHVLGPEDLRIMYSFGEAGTSSKYEAHSDNDVLTLLDCTPDQSMLDEGIAREVVNRIQKLRKKAGLKPQDEVTLYYKVEPTGHDLLRIINEHISYIETSTKNPLVLFTSANCSQKKKLTEEQYELKGAKLTLALYEGFHKDSFKSSNEIENKLQAPTYGEPKVKYVNVAHKQKVATVLLENPCNANNCLSYNQLCEEVKAAFDIHSSSNKLYHGGMEISQGNMDAIVGKTLTTEPITADNIFSAIKGSACPFVDITHGKKSATLLLENPVGNDVTDYANEIISLMFGLSEKSLKKFKNGKNTLEMQSMTANQWKMLYGKTVDLLL